MTITEKLRIYGPTAVAYCPTCGTRVEVHKISDIECCEEDE